VFGELQFTTLIDRIFATASQPAPEVALEEAAPRGVMEGPQALARLREVLRATPDATRFDFARSAGR
jgi:hypothetical protein